MLLLLLLLLHCFIALASHYVGLLEHRFLDWGRLGRCLVLVHVVISANVHPLLVFAGDRAAAWVALLAEGVRDKLLGRVGIVVSGTAYLVAGADLLGR